MWRSHRKRRVDSVQGRCAGLVVSGSMFLETRNVCCRCHDRPVGLGSEARSALGPTSRCVNRSRTPSPSGVSMSERVTSVWSSNVPSKASVAKSALSRAGSAAVWARPRPRSRRPGPAGPALLGSTARNTSGARLPWASSCAKSASAPAKSASSCRRTSGSARSAPSNASHLSGSASCTGESPIERSCQPAGADEATLGDGESAGPARSRQGQPPRRAPPGRLWTARCV